MRLLMSTAVIATLLSVPAAASLARAESKNSGPSFALFEGRVIDLRLGWGEATACTSDGITTECFRTQAERDAYLSAEQATPENGLGILSSCATTLKLYANASFGGSSLALSTRGTALNLSTWAFDNITSSYQVGACASTLYDGINASGSIYPGNTNVGASATSMLSGWDNRISSVFIS